MVEGIAILDTAYLIPFKAKAWLDLSDRKEAGEHVDSKNIRKHKNDVFRLTELLDITQRVQTPFGVFEDIKTFIQKMRMEDINVKQLGIVGKDKKTILDELEEIYIYHSEKWR